MPPLIGSRLWLRPAAVQIVNAMGVPGTAGALVRTEDGRRGFLTSHHVLFGRGAVAGDRVWLAGERKGQPRYFPLGRALRGQLGRVTHEGQPVFVDCAVGLFEGEAGESEAGGGSAHGTGSLPRGLLRTFAIAGAVRGPASPLLGARVSKTGAATGSTQGVIADLSYCDHPSVEGRSYEASAQLLIRPEAQDAPARSWRGMTATTSSTFTQASPSSQGAAHVLATWPPAVHEACFSAGGDSGAAVLDAAGRIVGLLWGSNANGEGIACPIAPALACLGLSLDLPPHAPLLSRLGRLARIPPKRLWRGTGRAGGAAPRPATLTPAPAAGRPGRSED